MYKFIIFAGVLGYSWALTIHSDSGNGEESIGGFGEHGGNLDFAGGFGGSSFGGGLSYGHGGEQLTFGEISLGHHHFDHELPGVSLSEGGDSFGGGHGLINEIGSWPSDSSGGHHEVKHIGVPVVKKVPVSVPHPVVQAVPQPYPVADIVAKPVPYEVVKQVFTKVEKKVPTPVHKIIPVPVHKPVPYHVYKHVPVPVVKKIPIKIPIYKTIVHKVKSHHH